MAQVVPFAPTPAGPFQFAAVLDGQSYTVIVTWNVSGQRWYVSVYTGAGDRVLSIAMVGSPDDHDISLVAGYFISTLVFRQSSQTFEVSP
ncbi:MAG: hypothetical protein WDN25_13435 [Acetobacteraceae bacterium]